MKRERKEGDRNETNETMREGKWDEEWAHSARIAARAAERWEKVLSGTPDRMCAASRKRRCSLLMWFMGRRMPFTSRGPSYGSPPSSPRPPLSPVSVVRIESIEFYFTYSPRERKRAPSRRVFMRACASHRCVTRDVNASCWSCFLADLSHTGLSSGPVSPVGFSV